MKHKKNKNANITLKDGSVVPARQAAGMHQSLSIFLSEAPKEFQSLLALAQGRDSDVNPAHFDELWAEAFVNDDRSIDSVVRAVLLNSYVVTSEGIVIAPLRLQEAADKPIAERAERERDSQFEKFWSELLNPKKNEGPSEDHGI